MKQRLIFILVLLFSLSVYGQQNLSADELFQKARTAAFEQKDYPTSIALAKQALVQSPDYTDISVFLGRLYTWSGETEAARKVFSALSEKDVKDEDFFLAFASLEYWNDQNTRAVEILDKGLLYHPQSEALLLLKAKAASAAGSYAAAEALEDILPNNFFEVH